MLTKNDLSKIQKVVQTEIVPLKKDINTVKEELADRPTKNDLTKELRPIKDDIAHIRKDIKTIISFFDREYLELRRRVEKIEEHLGLLTS